MKTARELYKEELNDTWFSVYSYQPMIDEIGNILIQVDDSDYQGDTRIMYEKEGKYGFLIFGWGSCSGCDMLQGCNSIEEVQDVFDGLVHDTKWFDNLEELKKYFREKDWELDYAWHADETKEFIQKVADYCA